MKLSRRPERRPSCENPQNGSLAYYCSSALEASLRLLSQVRFSTRSFSNNLVPLLRLSWETDTWASGEIDHAETISLPYLIVEQSLEWNSSHVSFVDFKKVFDSVDHAIL